MSFKIQSRHVTKIPWLNHGSLPWSITSQKVPQCGALRFPYGKKAECLSVLVGDCFFLQTIPRDWEGLRTSHLAKRWSLVRRWCKHLDFWENPFLIVATNTTKRQFKKKHSHGSATYRPTLFLHIRGATVRVDSPNATLDMAKHWGPCDDSHKE